MSSSIWTRAELSANKRAAAGRCWRLVEAQHLVSTAKLTDSDQEQERLEILLEESKPSIPEECRSLNYLLFTPFRYGAPYPHGSRFRRRGSTLGVFYAAELPLTAAIEITFHRLLFFAESPATPWPSNPGEYTAFAVDYAAASIDFMAAPFDAHEATWAHKTDYAMCQGLADDCRSENIDLIKYRSARCLDRATNVAILRCRAFAHPDVRDRQTWRIHLSNSGARVICEFPKQVLNFAREVFATDPRLAGMDWDR
ncbi:MAG TPA: RES family NAD+ phosphorylase [Xanthobacteraceae bacterium]|jgi:hypothetical protein|nr:RES family NAD+ phosphorylase [Xanthobacteraceae bacterium]